MSVESTPSESRATPETGVARALRGFLLGILVLSMAGVATELLLLKHTEGYAQKIPLVLLGLGLLSVIAHGALRRRATLRCLQFVMVAFVVSGGVGIFQHYTGNEEFELEMYPDLAGWDLVVEVLTGATPVLAPAAMAQMGLIGLAFAFRHPATRPLPRA